MRTDSTFLDRDCSRWLCQEELLLVVIQDSRRCVWFAAVFLALFVFAFGDLHSGYDYPSHRLSQSKTTPALAKRTIRGPIIRKTIPSV